MAAVSCSRCTSDFILKWNSGHSSCPCCMQSLCLLGPWILCFALFLVSSCFPTVTGEICCIILQCFCVSLTVLCDKKHFHISVRNFFLTKNHHIESNEDTIKKSVKIHLYWYHTWIIRQKPGKKYRYKITPMVRCYRSQLWVHYHFSSVSHITNPYSLNYANLGNTGCWKVAP